MQDERRGALDEDVVAVLTMLEHPVVLPPPSLATVLAALGAFGSTIAFTGGTPTSIFVGAVGLLVFGMGTAFGVLPRSRWHQLDALIRQALEGGLSVHETATTIGGTPSLRGTSFDTWIEGARVRVSRHLAALAHEAVRARTAPRPASSGPTHPTWAELATEADGLLAALVDAQRSTRPGPLRDRLGGVVAEARTVRADVQRLTVIGAAAGDGGAAREAATRVDELLTSLRVALDTTTRTLLLADRSDGIDTAVALQDAAGALLAAHEELAAGADD